MRKLIRQILILGLLGAWAVIAISSSESPSDRCTGEWENFFENNKEAAANSTTEHDAKQVVEMYAPGFRSLILW